VQPAFLSLTKAWPWLPHFRVVAEFENLGRASRKFGISTAALSKAIRTLETTIGMELFERTGGKLRLNDAGRTLLGVVRDQMRGLDDTLEGLRGDPDKPLRIAIAPAWARLLIPARASVELASPAITMRTLVRGEVDLLVSEAPLEDPNLETILVRTFACSLYAAPAHAARPSGHAVLADAGDVPRGSRIVATIDHLIASIASGHTGVLPDALGDLHDFTPVSDEPLPAISVWATTRRGRRGATRSAAARWRDDVLLSARAR